MEEKDVKTEAPETKVQFGLFKVMDFVYVNFTMPAFNVKAYIQTFKDDTLTSVEFESALFDFFEGYVHEDETLSEIADDLAIKIHRYYPGRFVMLELDDGDIGVAKQYKSIQQESEKSEEPAKEE